MQRKQGGSEVLFYVTPEAAAQSVLILIQLLELLGPVRTW